MHETRHDVIAAVAGSAVLVLATLLPLMRLARAEHLLPRAIRQAPLTVAALLMLLTPPTKGATHV